MTRSVAIFVGLALLAACFTDAPEVIGGTDNVSSSAATTNGTGAADSGSTSTDPGTTSVGPTATDETDSTSADVTDTADDAPSTDGEECGPGDCLPLAPNGWAGPVVALFNAGDQAPLPCPPGTEAQDTLSMPPIAADPLPCECLPGSPNCPNVLIVSGSSSTDCGNTSGQAQLLTSPESNSCPSASLDNPALRFDTGDADCQGTNVDPGIAPPPQWAEQAQICAPTNPAPCADGICGPPPSPARICIAQTGIVECPPGGPYTNPIQLFASAIDDRSCTQCTAVPDCGSVEVFDNPTCSGEPQVVFDALTDECSKFDSNNDVADESIQWAGPLGCVPDVDTMSIGTVMPSEPWTLCCLSE